MMAKRRMFSLDIIDTDQFMEMPATTQCLYFHLAMRADDDGFIGSVRKIMKMIGSSDDDFKLLLSKNFVILFEDGVCVIRHWRIHNYIQSDRYKKTLYSAQLDTIQEDIHGVYNAQAPCIQTGYSLDTQVRLGKVSIGKERIEKDTPIATAHGSPAKAEKHKHGEYKNVLLTDAELTKLQSEYANADALINFLSEAKEMKGYKYKSDYLAIKKWVVDAYASKNPTRETQEQRITRQLKEIGL